MTIERITPQQGPAAIQEAINDGAEHVHLSAGVYELTKPIFVQMLDRFRLTGDTDATLKHCINFGSTQPFLYDLVPDFVSSGITYDFNRVEWIEYQPGIRTQVPEWYEGKDGHRGPRDVQKYNLELTANRVIDSQNRRKNRSEGNRGDNWFLVLKDSFDNFNLNVEGNHIEAPDLEMTGGPQFFTNSRYHNNVLRGGQSTGGMISCLTKGQSGRRIANLQITDNLIQELNNYWISIGFDSDDSSEGIDFDNVLIRGNRAIYGETPARFCSGILFKYAKYTGLTQIFDNTFDGRGVSPKLTKSDFAPRTIAAKNFGVTAEEPSGHIYYDEPTVIYPDGAEWRASIPGTGRDRFATFASLS
jgi:hypothetical protein